MKRILRACKFLVRVMDDDETVEFAHTTVREYIKRSYGKWWDTEEVCNQLEEALYCQAQQDL